MVCLTPRQQPKYLADPRPWSAKEVATKEGKADVEPPATTLTSVFSSFVLFIDHTSYILNRKVERNRVKSSFYSLFVLCILELDCVFGFWWCQLINMGFEMFIWELNPQPAPGRTTPSRLSPYWFDLISTILPMDSQKCTILGFCHEIKLTCDFGLV